MGVGGNQLLAETLSKGGVYSRDLKKKHINLQSNYVLLFGELKTLSFLFYLTYRIDDLHQVEG